MKGLNNLKIRSDERSKLFGNIEVKNSCMLSRRLICNLSTIEEEASVEEIREAVQEIGKI